MPETTPISPQRRLLALWLPRLPLDRHARAEPHAADRPRAIVASRGGADRLIMVDAIARTLALRPGLSLADARARAPDLIAVPADPASDHRFLVRLARWAERYTPHVGLDGEDGLLLDITGAAHLHGGEAGLRDDLLARLTRGRCAARAAIAGTAAAAWALSRFARCGSAIVAAGGASAALGDLPPAALRLSDATLEMLDRLGVRRIAELRALPRQGLAARFGDEVNARLDAAFDGQAEPISPLAPAADWSTRLAFPEPIATAEDLARLVVALLAPLCARLLRAGLGARRLELRCVRLDGARTGCAIATALPERDQVRLARLFNERLSGIDPGLGIEAAMLTATRVAPLAPIQRALMPAQRNTTADLAPLIDAVTNRLGPRAAMHLRPVERHIPEAAQQEEPARADATDDIATPAAVWRSPWTGAAARPPQLLAVPEPITVTACLPDGPPLQFRHRGALHRVARADGPERIAPEWWMPSHQGASDGTRDYYRIEDAQGRRFWIYRMLDASGAPARWYLHGIFA
jgi:protein ImuB